LALSTGDRSPGLSEKMLTAAGHATGTGARFALTKFRPPALPLTLVTRPALRERLTAGSGKRLTLVVGSAGAGKSVLLADWSRTRSPELTSWLCCDSADADPVRFWAGFVEALRGIKPGFGAEAAGVLAAAGAMTPDVTASIANDAARLPRGSAIVVDDFHYASATASKNMTNLVERWPAETVQLVLSSRFDPPLRQHRLRMTGGLCEIRDRDLYFMLAETRALLAKFEVEISAADLALLHRRSEGWAAALQMAALSLRGTSDPVRVARALEVRGHTIAEYFITEVLDQQPPEVARFMLETSVLGELTADACAAVTGRQDATALLRSIEASHLFLVPLDDERSSYRYHQLVRQVLRAELRARDEAREQMLELRAGEWFEATGETRRAAHHFLAAQQVDRALAPLQDQVMADFLHRAEVPLRLDLGKVDSARLTDTPGQLLALAADQLLWGDTARGSEYLDLLEQARPSIPPRSRLGARVATMRSFRYLLAGHMSKAVREALAARVIQQQTEIIDEWSVAAALILMHAYAVLEDPQAAAREAATALAMPAATEPVKLIMVPGALALAWFQAGHLAKAADAAGSADAEAGLLKFGQHFFAIDHLRTLAGLALERREFDTAQRLLERALPITQHRPAFQFLVLLDRAQLQAARSQHRDALATVEAARRVLAGSRSVLLARADELEALIRLSLGDLRIPASLANGLPGIRRVLLLARIALAAGDHHAASEHLRESYTGALEPRHALVRQLLLAAAAVERRDPRTASIVRGALHAARQQGFLNTVVTTAPQVTSYLTEHSAQLQSDAFTTQLTTAARQVQATAPGAFKPGQMLTEPLTAAEQRILELLPWSTYLQIADTLYLSRNTVKTHLRSIYQKLGATSRSEALERAADLHLI
jgi:LuxR family transcriptional regulator, maltose regulon positive regulatory protein